MIREKSPTHHRYDSITHPVQISSRYQPNRGFFTNLSKNDSTGGFVPRWIIVDAPGRERRSTRSPFSKPAAPGYLAWEGARRQQEGQYDVIIIGTGAGGGPPARHLAPSGKRILLLERGDWLPREPENWSTVDVFVDGRYVSPDSWYDPKAKSFFQPQVHYFVGGATKLYGAALYRMRAEDFGELRHHDGLSPGLAHLLPGHGAVLHGRRDDVRGARRAG